MSMSARPYTTDLRPVVLERDDRNEMSRLNVANQHHEGPLECIQDDTGNGLHTASVPKSMGKFTNSS